MHPQTVVRAVLVFLQLCGLVLIAHGAKGMQGMVTYNVDTIEACTVENEADICGSSRVCCLFYEQSVGVCNEPGNCDRVRELTRLEKIRRVEFYANLKDDVPTQKAADEEALSILFPEDARISRIEALLGLLIFALASVGLVFSLTYEHHMESEEKRIKEEEKKIFTS
jgi:hypothetical protein